MKKITTICALLCMLFTANAMADTKTYDLVKADEGATLAPTYGETVTTGGQDLQLISVEGDDFDGRIAAGPTNRNNGTNNGFIFRTAGDWKGLWSQYNNRNISILNLKRGDKVTLTISKDAETLQLVGGDAVVSGQPITVTADGNLDFVTTGGVYIEQIEIEEAADGGDTGDDPQNDDPQSDDPLATKTYDFVVAETGSILLPTWGDEVTSGDVAMNMLATADNTFDNRFAVGPTTRNNDSGNCFKFRTASADYKGLWSQYSDRNFSILSLKRGDKVTFTISKAEQTLKLVDGDAVVSGQPITVTADGNLDFVTTGSVYIESVKIEPNTTTTAITTLPAPTAATGTCYNLNGQRVQNTQRGLYIKDGKKVLISRK